MVSSTANLSCCQQLSPVVAGDKVFLHAKVAGKDEEKLTIFEAATGKEVGSSVQPRKKFSSVFGLGPRATPIVTPDGTIVTFGVTGILNAQGSASNWLKDTLETNKAANLKFGVSASPIIDGDRVIVAVGGKGASLVAYNLKNGEVAWKTLNDPASYASPPIESCVDIMASKVPKPAPTVRPTARLHSRSDEFILEARRAAGR